MHNKFEKISFIILLITIFFTPLAFLPTSYTQVEIVKTVLITVGVISSILFYIYGDIKHKNLYVLKHPITYVSIGIFISLIVSTLISPNYFKSLFGQGFEVGTVSFIAVLFLGMFLTILVTNKNKDRSIYIFVSIIASFIIISLFHIIRFIGGPDTLTFSIFQSATSSVLGKWNDIGLLSGVVGLLSYIALRSLALRKAFKFLLIALILVSGFFITIVNSPIIWIILFFTLSLFFIYEYSLSMPHGRGIKSLVSKIPYITLILVVISFIGFWKGNDVMQTLVDKGVVRSEYINSPEVVLPWQLTLDVAADTIKESPLFGAGPNRFTAQYLKFKPISSVNPTIFWNTEFNSGFGFIPTFLITQGLVGFILWLCFLGIFINTGFKTLKKKLPIESQFFISSTFFTALFLWISSLLYIPSHTSLFFTFVLTGLFISSLIMNEQVSLAKIGDVDGHSIRKFIPIILIVVFAFLILWLAVFIRKTIAVTYFHTGISILNMRGNEAVNEAEKDFKLAIFFDENDTYYQALSEISIAKINLLTQSIQAEIEKTKSAPNQESITQIRDLIEQGLKYAKSAISIDPTNHYNYLAQARIAEVALTLQTQGAYELVKDSYNKALIYDPYDPSLYLNLARVEASQNKIAEAQGYIGTALQLKQNYLEAVFFLSQLQVNQGQIKNAITSVEFAAQINPNNPLIFFQLGLLNYNDKNYQQAIDALNKAIRLDNSYANAKYFLGLSYARVGSNADAIIQFEQLAISNPDNQEVSFILKNLKAGKSPFTDVKAPIDSKPEQRKNLPVREKLPVKAISR